MDEIVIKKAPFQGFGLKKLKGFYYLSAALYCQRECGIIFYDLLTGTEKKISLSSELSLGNVYSVYIYGVSDNTGYRFFTDDKTFADKYSKNISRIGNGLEVAAFTEHSGLKVHELSDKYRRNLEDEVFYLANVRGFTMEAPGIRGKRGSFKAFGRKLDYLLKLGVTSVVLMPVYESKTQDVEERPDRFREKPENVKKNYWGFGPAYHFAIKAELSCADPQKEFAELINLLHDNGLECILMMNFINDDVSYILDVLHFYLLTYKVDGFRLVGCGIDYNSVINDPLLSGTKLLFTDYDFSAYSFRNKGESRRLIDCSDRFLRESRRFLKGDEDTVSYLSYAVRSNHRNFSEIRNITDFSGFTLYDLVSYSRKHNEANGEDNTDGTDYNYSWNSGEEGPTNKRTVKKLRLKQVRNAMLLTCLCQCPPMLVSGDEVLNSALGNNNPYCQDNETGWVTGYKNADSKRFYSFCSNLLAFRKRHSILRQPKEVQLFDYLSCKVPDVSFHSAEAWRFDQTPVSRQFGILYYGDYSRQYTGRTESSVYIVYNMNWEKKDFVLPLKNGEWRLLYSTDGSTDETFDEENAVKTASQTHFSASGRSVSILLFDKKL